MSDELEELHKAKPIDSGNLEIKRRVEYRRRRLAPGEIPDFTVQHYDKEGTDVMESLTIVPTFVTDDGHFLDSHTDVKGYCYKSLKADEPKAPGCGALITKRSCSHPLCDRLMCPAHCRQDPEDAKKLWCMEHYEELYGSPFTGLFRWLRGLWPRHTK